MDGIQAVEHHGVFVGVRLLCLVGERLGMRPVMDAARVQRRYPGLMLSLLKKSPS